MCRNKDEKADIHNFAAKVKILVENGAPIEATSPSGNTALFYAARSGRAAIAEYLIEHAADVHAKNASKDTPLLFAASGSSLAHPPGSDRPNFSKLVTYLLDAGAKLDESNNNGLNAMHCASGSLLVVSAIIAWVGENSARKQALINALKQKTAIGETPLHIAAHNNEAEVVNLFLEHGADPLVRNKADKTPLGCTVDPSCIGYLRNAQQAVQDRYSAIQQELLDELASPSPQNKAKSPQNNKKPTTSNKKKAVANSKYPDAGNGLVQNAIASELPKTPPPTPASSTVSDVNPNPSSSSLSSNSQTPSQLQSSSQSSTDPSPQRSWASIAKQSSTVSTNPTKAITIRELSKEEQPALPPEMEKLDRPPQLPSDVPPELGYAFPTLPALESKLMTDYPAAATLGLQPHHLFGCDLHSLSMEQLTALQDIHQNEIRNLIGAQLDFVRRQERAWFQEELHRMAENPALRTSLPQ